MERVLPSQPFASLQDYLAAGGGSGLTAARAVDPAVVIAEVEASGLRGRGGAGFPTGTKWRTVAAYASPVLATTVVVNAAEGEPGTFKDRAILRANPYAVLEGALIAAHAVEATEIVVATKQRFTEEVARLRDAIAEIARVGWTDDIKLSVLEGPSEYLYGEETALLEVIDGRPPFPRIAPPYRRGAVEVVETDADAESGSGLAADVEMAGTDGESLAPPTLANNVETLANVPAIISRGAAWFRKVGTQESPGTIVVTLTGDVRRPGVGEVAMGSRLRDVIDEVGGGFAGRSIVGVLGGVSTALLRPDHLDVALTYEAMAAAGSALGSASFRVIDNETDVVALAAGVSRFLAIESCGQCTPCKQDGLVISDGLASLCRGEATEETVDQIQARLATVANGARCNLGRQHEMVVGSLLAAFPDAMPGRLHRTATPVEPVVVAELIDVRGDEEVVDSTFASKQPDWTHDEVYSGKAPVDLFSDHRAP